MNGKIEQGLHEKLCAYVLGELDGADRAEVERELMRSPELRAERERLESTIGAVRDAMQPAQLSVGAKEALERAVRPAPIAQFPWLRLAAGIGALGLGWWVFARTPATSRDVMVARNEAAIGVGPESAAERGASAMAEIERARRDWDQLAEVEKAEALRKLGGLGYGGGAVDAKSQPPATFGLDAATVGQSKALEEKRADVQFVDVPALAKNEGDAQATVTGTRLTPVPKPPEAVELVQADSSLRTVDSSGLNAPQEAAPVPAARVPRAETMVQGGGVSSQGARAAVTSTGVMTAGGGGGGGGATPGATGSYRGAGDSVPKNPNVSGPASPGPRSTGPSTPAPKGAATGGPASSAPSRPAAQPVELLAKLEPSNDAREKKDAEDGFLSRLGYTSHDDGDEAQRQQQKRWAELTADEQARRIEMRYGTIVEGCFPRPNERPRDMFFRFWGDNPFEVALLDKQSTFSVDVDTASYTLARRYLNEGKVPEKAQIRTEEFVNYFGSDVEAPRSATFSVHSDLTPSRFSADAARQMLRVVVRAKDVDKAERQPMHLTFVVDVSGSMKENDRLETVKHALRMLVAQLDARDSIALVTFSNDARLVLPMTAATDRTKIESAIAPLVYGGSTNSNAGLQLGYAQALQGLDPNVVNRVVFLSDGVANVGVTDAEQILAGVKSIREKGIFLNTIGVGMNNHNDVLLEQLADKGDGVCNYVDSPKEIQRALVDRFTGAFQPVAKDVKIQVEFDPQQVMRYRLLGYENRAIADADFRNDAVDAGELGAGHQVTALYEIEPTGSAGDGPMATVRLRWKPIRAAGTAGAQSATEASFGVSAKSYQAFEASPPGHRRALIVAQFAEILRRSIHARGESLDDLITEANRLQAQIPGDKEFAELTGLLVRTRDAIVRTLPACDDLCQTVDALRSNRYLGAVIHEAGSDAKTLQEIEDSRQKLEHRLRELLRQQAERGG